MTSRKRAAFALAARWLRCEIGYRHTDAVDWSVHCAYANWIVGKGMCPGQADVAEIAESLSLDGVDHRRVP